MQIIVSGTIQNEVEEHGTPTSTVVTNHNIILKHGTPTSTVVTNYNIIFLLPFKTSIAPPPFIEVPMPFRESELSCLCLLAVSIFPNSTIYLLDFRSVPKVWYFCFSSSFFYTLVLSCSSWF